jgi:alginate O-acetyltransferase complex protein AlgI
MYFTSPVFFAFLALVLTGIALLRSQPQKVLWLLAAGAFFYGYWDWRFLGLLSFVSVFEFWMAKRISQSSGARRRWWLALYVAVNLSLLSYFKYVNFFIDSLSPLLAPHGISIGTLDVILPIGISFFTFEAMSYAIDVYRGRLEPFDKWTHFALFIFFFPRMISGPIIRASDFIPQLSREIALTRSNIVEGATLFATGLTKKLVIADRVGAVADVTFANPAAYTAFSLWQGAVAYGIQIFCDFSGYSDMAIGIAKVLGFDLPENFNMPYISTSLTEFWRRWHISLSTWLRDYLYVPLGGNRDGAWRTYRNLFLTMLLGGLWHGAAWTFVAWGAAHGLGLAIERLTKDARASLWKAAPSWLPVGLGWLWTQLFVLLCWVLFRAQSFDQAAVYVARMFSVSTVGIDWAFGPLWVVLPLVLAAHIVGVLWGARPLGVLRVPSFRARLLWSLWALGILYLGTSRASGFIYFQF